MRNWFPVLSAVALLGGIPAVVCAGPHMTRIPEGQFPAEQIKGTVACDSLLRYDDGTDDRPGSGYTLGWFEPTQYQYLGVRFTPPATGSDYQVQSASFLAEFWIRPGPIEVHAQQLDDPTNQTVASVNVTDGGIWEVEFATPICIPGGKEYVIMLCATPDGGFGVTGEDTSAPDGRSTWSFNGPCAIAGAFPDDDLMIWSCVTECAIVPTLGTSWGRIKSVYR